MHKNQAGVVAPQTRGVAAGWYADPQGQPQNRFWDGIKWTEHTQALPPPMTAWTAQSHDPYPAPVMAVRSLPGPGSNAPNRRYDPYNPDADRAAGKNTPARNGLIWGILCLLANPLFLVGVAGIVWASVGLGRANRWAREGWPATGRTQAVWGLVLGIIGTLGTLILKGGLF